LVDEANTVGLGLTVSGDVVLEHPVTASVKVKVALPCPTAVATLPDTVATDTLLLTQVPPVEGVNVTVFPTHVTEELSETVGLATTVIESVQGELHPEDV
jgi:hypothetical protein